MTPPLVPVASPSAPAPAAPGHEWTRAELERNLAEWMRRTPAEVEASRRMFERGPRLRGERP